MSQILPFIAPPKEFTLGGLRYAAPGSVGAGIQAEVIQRQLAEYAKTDEYKSLVSIERLRKEAKNPEALEHKMQVLEKEISSGFTIWGLQNVKICNLIMFQILLTPCGPNYPSMKDVYDQLATGEEADVIINFFNGTSPRKKSESNSSSNSDESRTTAEPEIRNSSQPKKRGKK